jgi:hypothetical protein
MLRNAVAAFLEQLTEREFDAPFVALLRAMGFFDIHRLHGQYEFGKDFIAKRTEDGVTLQYVFQTKAGDIGQNEWGKIRPQLDELRESDLGHPNLNRDLERRPVLVTTGRLVGKVGLSLQEVNEQARQRGLPAVTLWAGENLLEYIVGSGSAEAMLPATANLQGVISKIQEDKLLPDEIEVYTRKWVTGLEADPTEKTLWATILEGCLLADRLNSRNRSHLGVRVALGLQRVLEPIGADALEEHKGHASGLIGMVLESCSTRATEGIDDSAEGDASEVLGFRDPVTYAVGRLVLAETLALRGIYFQLCDRGDLAHEETERLIAFLDKNPSAAHPISDRYAATILLVGVLLLAAGRREEANEYLVEVIKWVCDAYEKKGLAGVHASERQEIEHLVGYSFEHLAVARRRESYLATAVLDLLLVAGEAELYENAVNDFKAVDIFFTLLLPDGTDVRFFGEAQGTVLQPSIPYPDHPTDEGGWQVVPHQRAAPAPRLSPWGAVALTSLLRDRHWVHALFEQCNRQIQEGSE